MSLVLLQNFFIVISSFFLAISSSCFHRLLNHSILEMDGAVGDGSKALIMSYDDESLTELVSEVEEELVKLSLVLGVETS